MIVWIGLLVLVSLVVLVAGALLVCHRRHTIAREQWLYECVARSQRPCYPSLWEEHAKEEEKAQAILRAAKGDR